MCSSDLYMARLGTRMRHAIIDGTYGAWRDAFLGGYRVADESVAQTQRERRVAAWQATRPDLDARVGAGVVGADADEADDERD